MKRTLSALAATLALASGASAAAPPTVPTGFCCGLYPHAIYGIRPARITVAQAEMLAGYAGRVETRSAFGRISWRTWTRTQATARAMEWALNCTPDCATGPMFAYQWTSVRMWRPAGGYFTRMTLTPDFWHLHGSRTYGLNRRGGWQ